MLWVFVDWMIKCVQKFVNKVSIVGFEFHSTCSHFSIFSKGSQNAIKVNYHQTKDKRSKRHISLLKDWISKQNPSVIFKDHICHSISQLLAQKWWWKVMLIYQKYIENQWLKKTVVFCKYLCNESSDLHEILCVGQLLSCEHVFHKDLRINAGARVVNAHNRDKTKWNENTSICSQDSNWPPYKISWRSELSLRRYLQNKLAFV